MTDRPEEDATFNLGLSVRLLCVDISLTNCTLKMYRGGHVDDVVHLLHSFLGNMPASAVVDQRWIR